MATAGAKTIDKIRVVNEQRPESDTAVTNEVNQSKSKSRRKLWKKCFKNSDISLIRAA